MDLYSIKANETFDYELVEVILGYLAFRVPALGDVSGEFENESRLISERTYEIRVANKDETAVFAIDYEKGYGKYEPQIRIRSILLKGRYKGIGFAKGLINYLVEFCDAKKNGTTLWIVDVINREWKMYLLSQGAKLVQDETVNAGAILYIPEKIGLKKKEHIYVDEFDKELIDYLTQFFKLEGVALKGIKSHRESDLIYGIVFDIGDFLLHFQYEKESSAGEAQIRFELRLNDSGERPMGIPGDLLLNMLNVLLLYCRVHGTMTLWVFNARALSSGFADFLIAKRATVMADNPAGFNGGTVLTIERKLK